MRFLVDGCTGPAVARWLKAQGHEVYSVYDEARGMTDDDVIAKAFGENWILITNDKDFGEKVYREGHSHHGIVLLRLENERAANKIATLDHLLNRYHARLPDNFTVVTEKRVRFAQQ